MAFNIRGVIMTDNIKKCLKESINNSKYNGYIDNIFIAYNNTHEIDKLDLFKEEMIIDSTIYNTSFKKVNKLQYNIERYYVNNNGVYDIEKDNCKLYYYLKLNPIKVINSLDLFYLKLKEIEITKVKPKLLLHSCCGPCSSYCLSYLNKYFDISILYYNPNIDTLSEFNKRLDYQKKIIDCLGYNIPIIVPEYNHNSYLEYIKGFENEKEGSKRCYLCYKERLCKLIEYSNDFDYVTTTLSVSPYKNSNWINEIGLRLSNKYMYSNFKLNDGYKASIELSKKYNLYRQEYCGCEFSRLESSKKLK